MIIASPAFEQGQPIPKKYACDGQQINPPLDFLQIPTEAKTLALVMDDPDAPGGTFVHWLLWNLPAESEKIAEGHPDIPAISGMNSYNRLGYAAPCPPNGQEHRYFFRLYALDIILDLQPGSTLEQLNLAMGGHIITATEFFGTYQKAL